MSAPTATRILETVLYADDLAAAADFYVGAMGLPLLASNELMLVLQAGDNHLLIFDATRSSRPGRDVPSHGGAGPGHIAFVAAEADLPAWKSRLASAGVEIESEVEWDGGRGRSIYVRDPAGNSVELAPGGLWSHLSVLR